MTPSGYPSSAYPPPPGGPSVWSLHQPYQYPYPPPPGGPSVWAQPQPGNTYPAVGGQYTSSSIPYPQLGGQYTPQGAPYPAFGGQYPYSQYPPTGAPYPSAVVGQYPPLPLPHPLLPGYQGYPPAIPPNATWVGRLLNTVAAFTISDIVGNVINEALGN